MPKVMTPSGKPFITLIKIKDKLSDDEKVKLLKEELGYHHKTNDFDTCKNMGEIVLTNVELLLKKEFKQSILPSE